MVKSPRPTEARNATFASKRVAFASKRVERRRRYKSMLISMGFLKLLTDVTACTIRTVRISISLAGKRSLQGIYVAAGSSVARATVRIDLI